MPASNPSKVSYQRLPTFEGPIHFPSVAQNSSSSAAKKVPSHAPVTVEREDSADRLVARQDSAIDVSNDIYLASRQQQQQHQSQQQEREDDGEQTPTRGRSQSPKPVLRYAHQHHTDDIISSSSQRRVRWADGWQSPLIPASPKSETPCTSPPAKQTQPLSTRHAFFERHSTASLNDKKKGDASLVGEVAGLVSRGVLMLVKASVMVVLASALAWTLVNALVVSLSMRTFSDAWAELGIEQMLFEEFGLSMSEAVPAASDGFERLWSSLASVSADKIWGETVLGYLLVVMVFGWLKLLMTVYHSFVAAPKTTHAMRTREALRGESVIYGPKGFGQA